AQFIKRLRPEEDDERPQERLPAFQAVSLGDEAAVEAYLADGGSVDLRNAEGETLLMCAARWSWPRLVKRLLAAGAAVDARDAHAQTPLYFAMHGQSSDSIKLLAAAGANLAYRDRMGHCLVQRARELHFWGQANKLVELGAPER
ncbi:MAG TPA: ankyrin repeat domain-containing protein, partial [Pirellulales bacterium]